MSTSTILPVIHPVEGELHAGSLARLHASIVDAAHLVEHLGARDDASMTPVLDAFSALHERHRHDLVAEMAGKGHPPEEEGTLQDLVRWGKEQLRDLVTSSSGDQTRRHFLDHEIEVIEAYNAALTEGGPADTIELLQRQREELGQLVATHDPRLAE